jgi:hypothetical protein
MYLNKSIVLLISSSLFVTACTAVGNMAPAAVAQEPIIIPIENPRPIITRPVEFIVITENNREKLDSERVWYAITTKSYENLAYNMQELIRYISQQQNQIKYYTNNSAN